MNVKVKEFVKKHKKAIINGAILIGGVFVGYCVSNKLCKNNMQTKGATSISDDFLPYDDTIKAVLKHSEEVHPGLHRTFGLTLDTKSDALFKIADLGTLGDEMRKCGVNEKQTFTDFICIGENME